MKVVTRSRSSLQGRYRFHRLHPFTFSELAGIPAPLERYFLAVFRSIPALAAALPVGVVDESSVLHLESGGIEDRRQLPVEELDGREQAPRVLEEDAEGPIVELADDSIHAWEERNSRTTAVPRRMPRIEA